MHTSRIMRSNFNTVVVIAGLVLLLTSSLARASFPGKNGRIVFVANPGGNWQLYTIRPDGTDMIQLTRMDPTSDSSWEPSFSPDGSRLAFDYGPVDSSGNAHPDLYVINADGTGLTQLTHDGLSQAPRWSPDGTKLIFARQSTLTNQTVVTVMRADGTGEKTALTSDFWLSFPDSYTPDGSKINFDSSMGGLVSAEWIMNADGSGLQQLTAAPLEGGVSDVSPDGKHIVLNSHNNSPLLPAIFVMNLDGGNLHQVSFPPDGAVDVSPVYSPDGTKIVFASSRIDPGSLDLFVMNADGSGITAIATGLTVGGCSSGNCVEPSWGPDPEGDSIAEPKASDSRPKLE
jgi:TolB protein